MHSIGTSTHKPSGWLKQAKIPLFAVILFSLLAACQAGHSTPTSLPFNPTFTFSPQYSATIPATANPTSVLSFGTQVSQLPVQSSTPFTTAAPDPLRFVFPTPGPAPVSAWRPPLYPTPWAPTPYDHFYFARPIAADEVNWPVADYRYGGVFFQDVVHTGVDIPAPKGTPVLAAGPGTVVWAGYGVYRGGYDASDPYGLAVTIRHDFGYQNQALYTVYGHMDEIDVAEGQHVETGDFLGLVGETGRVTGPHLHFEVRIGNNSYFTTRNPELWTVPPVGWGVVAGRVMDSGGGLVTDQLFIITFPQSGQNWFARTYGPTSINSDPYYRENIAVGDLPAGIYELRTAYAGFSYTTQIEVHPGLVSYFVFQGFDGFTIEAPPAPGIDFTPPPLETPTP